MNAPQAPLPASLSRLDGNGAALDARILRAEQCLILREENLRRRTHALTSRVRQAVQPVRRAAPLAGGVLALVALGWLWRRHRPASGGNQDIQVPERTASGPARAAQRVRKAWRRDPSRDSQWPLANLLSLALSLLPVAWRTRISPASASTVLALALPLARRLLARRTPSS
jgi:hypothetical protein